MAEERVQNLLSQLSQSGKHKSLPIFLKPYKLEFQLEDESSHRQKLTIYNPYEFPVLYHISVEWEHRNKYHIPEGESPLIASHDYVQIIFTHLKPVKRNLNINTLFLITMSDPQTKKELGKKCIVGTLESLYGVIPKNLQKSATESDEEEEEEKKSTSSKNEKRKKRAKSRDRFTTSQVRLLLILAAILFSTLMLPLEDTWKGDAIIPKCLHLTVGCKITLSFFFGIVVYLLWERFSVEYN